MTKKPIFLQAFEAHVEEQFSSGQQVACLQKKVIALVSNLQTRYDDDTQQLSYKKSDENGVKKDIDGYYTALIVFLRSHIGQRVDDKEILDLIQINTLSVDEILTHNEI